MQTDSSRIYVMPLVSEKLPSVPPMPPPTQRELVRASLLACPDSSSKTTP